jgi:hypothetical protein
VAGAARTGPSAEVAAGAAPTLALPEPLLVDAVAALAAARTELDVAGACLPLLVERPGVRATAVVQRRGRTAVVLGSSGYPCGSMAVGAELPLDASLPVTEAVRTGRTVVQGTGPSWVALPLGSGLQTAGALLLSLTGAPPGPNDLARLQRLARVLGDALRRAAGQDRDAATLAAVTAGLSSTPVVTAALDTAVRSVPAAGEAGGDVLACLPAHDGGAWLVAADVCGSGMSAALVAAGVRTALRSCAATSSNPSRLLSAVEDAVAPDVGAGSFVTAVAVQVSADGRSARVASAGHPPPLLVHGGRAVAVAVEPGPPLALEGRVLPDLSEATTALPPGAALLLHTDGLVERRTADGIRLLDAQSLAAGLADDLEQAADAVLAAAAAVGAAHDDVSLLLARPRTPEPG